MCLKRHRCKPRSHHVHTRRARWLLWHRPVTWERGPLPLRLRVTLTCGPGSWRSPSAACRLPDFRNPGPCQPLQEGHEVGARGGAHPARGTRAGAARRACAWAPPQQRRRATPSRAGCIGALTPRAPNRVVVWTHNASPAPATQAHEGSDAGLFTGRQPPGAGGPCGLCVSHARLRRGAPTRGPTVGARPPRDDGHRPAPPARRWGAVAVAAPREDAQRLPALPRH